MLSILPFLCGGLHLELRELSSSYGVQLDETVLPFSDHLTRDDLKRPSPSQHLAD